jgi:hypothetical protein
MWFVEQSTRGTDGRGLKALPRQRFLYAGRKNSLKHLRKWSGSGRLSGLTGVIARTVGPPTAAFERSGNFMFGWSGKSVLLQFVCGRIVPAALYWIRLYGRLLVVIFRFDGEVVEEVPRLTRFGLAGA